MAKKKPQPEEGGAAGAEELAPEVPGVSYDRGGPGPVQPPEAFVDENDE